MLQNSRERERERKVERGSRDDYDVDDYDVLADGKFPRGSPVIIFNARPRGRPIERPGLYPRSRFAFIAGYPDTGRRRRASAALISPAAI